MGNLALLDTGKIGKNVHSEHPEITSLPHDIVTYVLGSWYNHLDIFVNYIFAKPLFLKIRAKQGLIYSTWTQTATSKSSVFSDKRINFTALLSSHYSKLFFLSTCKHAFNELSPRSFNKINQTSINVK